MLKDLATRFEKASALYAATHELQRDRDWFMLKLQEEIGELTQAFNRLTGRGRAKGRTREEIRQDLADEAADVLGHILLLAHQHELDLEAAIERKWLFRP
ncbi:MazG nucleotide pyrophosphohydrolase domain-containing protein [Rhizobium oryzicola]|uniref:MazG nucleotide pyrophosphohydrolase domain-containing protein n=1 Tax=Rhizobium oryzicola TaxID=1232668 RepID=A0ABT8SSE3_9HYPH|nr:MazG nucleotide pyrophosphohydrolase domain-containing protein [Rhizobium oryzicola]MDO1581294.1 MazG nucleotide pyrophosphohydrolase domain-containing protein [Rhizobium oryzicola]